MLAERNKTYQFNVVSYFKNGDLRADSRCEICLKKLEEKSECALYVCDQDRSAIAMAHMICHCMTPAWFYADVIKLAEELSKKTKSSIAIDIKTINASVRKQVGEGLEGKFIYDEIYGCAAVSQSSGPYGIGWTREEALEDLIKQLQKKAREY